MKTNKIFFGIFTMCLMFTACHEPNVNPRCNTPEILTGKQGSVTFSKENSSTSINTSFTDLGKTYTYTDCDDSTFAVIVQGSFAYKYAPSGKTSFIFKNKFCAERGGTFYVQDTDESINKLDSNEVYITNSIINEATPFLVPKTSDRYFIAVDDNTITLEDLPIVSINGNSFFTIESALINF